MKGFKKDLILRMLNTVQAKLKRLPFLPDLTGLIGFGLYLFRGLQAAYSLRSPMDEGNFIVKGLYFASGQYIPYQPYGFWVNKMPLSFLIPGWILQFFEPGIASARYFALAISLLFLLGLFLLIRRESNLWLAALSVWVFALNPILIKIYGLAISQGLAACIFVWSLYFYFGKNRRIWQIVLGAFLTGVLIMTRENMLPVLFYLWIYIFVRRRRAFWPAVLVSLAPILCLHALYFPDIMNNWIDWIPSQFVQNQLYIWLGIIHPLTEPAALIGGSFIDRVDSFLEGIRANLWIFMAFIVVLWAAAEKKIKNTAFETLSLSALFLLLTVMHAWASVGMDYCVYCFQNYVSFFSFLGILIFALTLAGNPIFPLQKARLLTLTLGLLSAIVLVACGYKDMFHSSLYQWMSVHFWKFPFPRIKNFRIAEGSMDLHSVLINKFSWDIGVADSTIFPLISALMLVLFLFTLLWGIHAFINRRYFKSTAALYWNRFVVLILIFVLAISPTFLAGNSAFSYQCQNNVIQSIQAAGQSLAEIIEPGSVIDWRTQETAILLLYLEDIEIHPPQLNLFYSYEISDETDLIYRSGKWNKALSLQWLDESDYLITTSDDIKRYTEVQLQKKYTQVGPPIYLYTCNDEIVNILVFRRNQ
jgi:hypothetical protein